jgi:hypothetical protein
MVLNIGSMAVKAVFNGAGLLSGLGKTSDKFKEVSMRSKSTTTEMKRMRGSAHKLRNALAAIGVGGFTALMMSAPQLAGSLAKIKYEMTQLAWSIGKHLKPTLDSVATILRGIRTGDWSTVIQGVSDLANSLLTLADKAITVTLDTIFGEGTAKKTKIDFNNWITSLEEAWDTRDLPGLIKVGLWEPFEWASTKLGDFQRGMMTELEGERGDEKGARARGAIKTGVDFIKSIGDWQRGTVDGSMQIGGYVPQTGLYQLHAGETVTMKGSSGMKDGSGSSNITLDFSGANINLANGIELNEFANQISLKIAERQNSLTY